MLLIFYVMDRTDLFVGGGKTYSRRASAPPGALRRGPAAC